MKAFEKQEVQKIVIDLIADISGEDEIGDYPDLDLFDEGFLDSLTGIELMVKLNDVFEMGIEVSDFDIDNLGTVNRIVDFCTY